MAVVRKDNAYNPFGCDNGDYLAVVEEIKAQDSERFDKKPFLIWTFRLKDPVRSGEYVDDDVSVSGTTPSIPVEGQKFDNWLKACNVILEDGEDFDTDELVGKTVKVVVKSTPNPKTGKLFCHVTDLLPIRKKPPVRPVAESRERQKPLARVREDVELDDDAEAQAIIEEVAERAAKSGVKADSANKKSAAKARSAKEAAEKAIEEELFEDFKDEDDDGILEDKLGESGGKSSSDDDVPF